MPHRRPDAVGADQRQRQFLLPRVAAALDHRQSLGVRGHVLELAAEPQVDVGMVVDRGLQRRLQIGAMHHPIGRAGAQRGGFAERQAGDLAAGARAHDADGVGRHGAGGRAAASGRDRSGRGWHWATSCRPAPTSSSRSAFSSTTTRKPWAASASDAVSPPIPAPATKMVRDAATEPIRRPCPSARIPAAGLRRRRGRRQSDTASSNRGR